MLVQTLAETLYGCARFEATARSCSPVTSPPRLTPRGYRRSAKDSFALLGARGRLEQNGRLSCPITPIASLHDTLRKATGGYQTPGGTLARRFSGRPHATHFPPLALPSPKVSVSIRARSGPRSCTSGLERRFRRCLVGKTSAAASAGNRNKTDPTQRRAAAVNAVYVYTMCRSQCIALTAMSLARA